MSYDAIYRHQQALDPSAINTLPAALHALNAAIADCRTAGIMAEADPAVLLLARRLGTVATTNKPSNHELHRACAFAVAYEITTNPALRTIMTKNLSYNPNAKNEFHKEGRKALRRLAAFLELAPGTFEILSIEGSAAASGKITLQGSDIYVSLQQQSFGRNEILYRRAANSENNHFANVDDLLNPERFAKTLRHNLGLMPSLSEPVQLVA